MTFIFDLKYLFFQGRNAGRCLSAPGSTSYQCQCSTGYSGRNCEHVDVCNVKNPCICGTCTNDPNSFEGFRCFCPVGYTGARCERG